MYKYKRKSLVLSIITSIAVIITSLVVSFYIFKPVSAEFLHYSNTRVLEGTGYNRSHGSTVDSLGNLYITGDYSGTVNFNPNGTDERTALASTDIFLSKYNADGTYAWTKTIESSYGVVGYDVVLDSSNNIYLTGQFNSFEGMNFNPDGSDIKLGYGSFLTKYNSDGSYSWTKTWGGTPYYMEIGSDNNIYIVGTFTGTQEFNPDGGNSAVSNGSNDIYLLKLDSNGNFGYVRTFGGTDWENPGSLSLDSSNNAYVFGEFRGTVNFNWSGTDNRTSLGNSDSFITKVNADGTYGWTKTWGGSGRDMIVDSTIDSSNNIYVTGVFPGTVNFNPDGTNNKVSNGQNDVFLSKFNSDGTYAWTNTWGGNYGDWGTGVRVDSNGVAYVSGYFLWNVDFDTGAGTNIIDATYYEPSMFVSSFDTNGEYIWTSTTFGYKGAFAYKSEIFNDKLFVTGGLYGDEDFDPKGAHDYKKGRTVGTTFITEYTLSNIEPTSPVQPVVDNPKVIEYCNSETVNIPDNNPTGGTSSIVVDRNIPFYKVGVSFVVSHTDPRDLVTYLEHDSPSGTSAPIVGKFPCNVDHMAVTLDPDATGSLYYDNADSCPSASLTGTYSPDFPYPLHSYSMEGTWKLKFVDTSNGDTGTIDKWCVRFTVEGESVEGTQYEYDSHVRIATGSMSYDPGQVVSDSENNLYYFARVYTGGVDIDPSPDSEVLTSIADAWVVIKLTENFEYIWHKEYSAASGNFSIRKLLVDSDDNIYVAGHFRSSYDFNPSGTSQLKVSNGYDDIYVTKLTKDADFVFVNTFGGTKNEKLKSFKVDSNDGIYLGGQFSSPSIDFGNGFVLSNPRGEGGHVEWGNGDDLFVVKYDKLGSVLKALPFSMQDMSGYAYLNDIAFDSGDNLYVSGSISSGSIDLNPNEGEEDLYDDFSVNSLAFLTRINNNGSYGWSKITTSENYVDGYLLNIDSTDTIYVAGTFYGDFGYDASYLDLSNPLVPYYTATEGDGDNYLQKYSTNGDFIGVLTLPGGGDEWPEVLGINKDDNVFFGGPIDSFLDMDPSEYYDGFEVFSSGNGFFTQLNQDSNYVFGYHFDSQEYSNINGLAFDNSNNMYVAVDACTDLMIDPITKLLRENTETFACNMFLIKFVEVETSNAVSIKDIPEGLKILDGVTEADLTIPSEDHKGNGKRVKVYVEALPNDILVAEILADIQTDLSWPGIDAGASKSEKKSFIKDLTDAQGTANKNKLYVPKDAQDNKVRLCMNAQSLVAITRFCTSGVDLTEADANVRVVIDGGNQYWEIDDVEDVGGISVYEPPVVPPIEDEEAPPITPPSGGTTTPPTTDIEDETEEPIDEDIDEDIDEVVPVVTPPTPLDETPEVESESIITKIVEGIKEVVTNIINRLQSMGMDSTVTQTVAVGSFVVVATGFLLNTLAVSTGTSIYSLQLMSSLFFIKKLRKKDQNFGLVYDSVTKEPINRAIVRISDSNGTLISTEVTDIYGIFDARLETGSYRFSVEASGYNFPSRTITLKVDEPYMNVYHGEEIVHNNSDILNISIPLDREDSSLVSESGASAKNIFMRFFDVSLYILFIVGFISTVFTLVNDASALGWIMLSIYILFTIGYLIVKGNEGKKFGFVRNSSGSLVEGLELGLMELEFNQLAAKRVTDGDGKYRFIVPGGKYRLVVLNPGYELLESKNDLFEVKDGSVEVVKENIVVSKK
jgi:subtilisin-like proprotein convertase family protein/predicted RNA-binding protein Jag